MKRESNLKKTELDLLPEEWQVAEFEDCILKQKVKVGKVNRRNYKRSGKYPIIDQSQHYIAGYWEPR